MLRIFEGSDPNIISFFISPSFSIISFRIELKSSEELISNSELLSLSLINPFSFEQLISVKLTKQINRISLIIIFNAPNALSNFQLESICKKKVTSIFTKIVGREWHPII
ncbi:MAG: hypothetical protein CL671_14880 [Balneola sp.]|nr:hypothetical protein [Balneola sp.]MAO77076.1 hypothetical protein [Balneola sp.]MBF64643.1 hypothetical protein [Balneola sp.]MBF65895.1 hypothetical protein [Balneola sp.]|tara:strand:+ start:896 stop:1225 length:330 start_codon:yes stop_codon:yes gene_type:complete